MLRSSIFNPKWLAVLSVTVLGAVLNSSNAQPAGDTATSLDQEYGPPDTRVKERKYVEDMLKALFCPQKWDNSPTPEPPLLVKDADGITLNMFFGQKVSEQRKRLLLARIQVVLLEYRNRPRDAFTRVDLDPNEEIEITCPDGSKIKVPIRIVSSIATGTLTRHAEAQGNSSKVCQLVIAIGAAPTAAQEKGGAATAILPAGSMKGCAIALAGDSSAGSGEPSKRSGEVGAAATATAPDELEAKTTAIAIGSDGGNGYMVKGKEGDGGNGGPADAKGSKVAALAGFGGVAPESRKSGDGGTATGNSLVGKETPKGDPSDQGGNDGKAQGGQGDRMKNPGEPGLVEDSRGPKKTNTVPRDGDPGSPPLEFDGNQNGRGLRIPKPVRTG